MNGPLEEESELVTNIFSEISFDKTEIDDEGRNAAYWVKWLIGRTGTLLSLRYLVRPPSQAEHQSSSPTTKKHPPQIHR